jgi:hypothetical protein
MAGAEQVGEIEIIRKIPHRPEQLKTMTPPLAAARLVGGGGDQRAVRPQQPPERLRHAYADWEANRLPPPWGRTYPIGLDTEVCTFQALEIAWREADQAHQREHVMPYLYEHQERFHILLVNHEEDHAPCAGRWTRLKTWNNLRETNNWKKRLFNSAFRRSERED